MRIILLILSAVVLTACDKTQNANQDTETVLAATEAEKNTEALLNPIGSAYITPSKNRASAPVWEKPGALNAAGNQILTEISEITSVSLLERETTSNSSVYFLVDLPDGMRGYVAKIYLSKDASGNVFYEPNSITKNLVIDGANYSFAPGENCNLHRAALEGG